MLGEEREVGAAAEPVPAAPAFPPVDPQMTAKQDSSRWPPPARPAPSYPAPSYPAPSYPAPSYPAPSYPAPTYPGGSAPSAYDPYAARAYAAAPQQGNALSGNAAYGYAPMPAWMPAPPPSRMKRRTVVIAVVTVLAVLVATVGGIAIGVRSSAQRRQETLAAATAAVTAHLPALETFVASATARPWKRPVTPEVLDDAAFVAALHSGSSDDVSTPADDNDDMGVTVTALGLASSADAFWRAYDQGTDDNVVGFYDDSTGRLVVRGASWTPDLEYTLVHELTHANQDQSFDLSTLWDRTRTDDESATALRGLVEGEASLVADDYYESRDTSWQDAVDARSSSATASRIPVVDTLAGFPYQAGEEFVAGLRDSGGTAAVTKAYAAPPRWTRDLVDPEGWLAGTLPKVTKPPLPTGVGRANADIADYGVLGVLGLWMTADGGDPNPSDIDQLDGWTGDAYVATENVDTSQVCITDDVTFTSVAGRDKAFAYLTPWLKSSGTTAADTGPTSMRLHRCQG